MGAPDADLELYVASGLPIATAIVAAEGDKPQPKQRLTGFAWLFIAVLVFWAAVVAFVVLY